MKTHLLTLLLVIFIFYSLHSQEVKLPLEMKSSHLQSQWKINNNIDTKVFLETGFPNIIINENFAKKHLQGIINLTQAPDNAYIKLWNNNSEKLKITYYIYDTLIINGVKIKTEILVANIENETSWKHYDMIFPLCELTGKVELNISENYMKILDYDIVITKDFLEYDVKTDSTTKGFYLTTSMKIFDKYNTSEELKGNFILDLGAGAPLIINKNIENVKDFVLKSDRMLLKDTTQFKPNPSTELSILMPYRIQIDKIEIKEIFIAAMKVHASKTTNNFVGIIGNPFFANFIIIFDFENDKFYIKPNSDKAKILE